MEGVFQNNFAYCVLTIISLATQSYSYSSYQLEIPNGDNVPHPCKVNYRWPGLGHNNPYGGGIRNVFGKAFQNAGFQWTRELCMQDSDGDGKTNGEELGDPSCTWTKGKSPWHTDITHPGVCEPMDSDLCLGRNEFVDCRLQEFENCDRIQEPEIQNISLTFPKNVVPTQETSYYCMTFDLPSDKDYHIIAFEPVIDNRNVMHHILLYGCKTDNAVRYQHPTQCGMNAERMGCFDIIAAWTVGSPGICLPETVGYRMGKTSYKMAMMQAYVGKVYLGAFSCFYGQQEYTWNGKDELVMDEIVALYTITPNLGMVHWNNPKLVENYTDSSGVRLYYQPARANVTDLAMFAVGQNILEIPPGMTNVSHYGTCPGSCTSKIFSQPFYVIRGLNHMHYLGRMGRTELFRNGSKVTDLTYDEMYSYDSPINHVLDPPVQVLPGDEIRTTCAYNSVSSGRYVYFGEATQDEMCLTFLTVYPAKAVQITNNCVQVGPLTTCNRLAGLPYEGCEWQKFTNLAHPTMSNIVQRLWSDCTNNGYCRPECKEVRNEISQHPCMQGEVVKLINLIFQMSKSGVDFMIRYNSCARDEIDQLEEMETCSKETCGC